jgi:hypothetical protein
VTRLLLATIYISTLVQHGIIKSGAGFVVAVLRLLSEYSQKKFLCWKRNFRFCVPATIEKIRTGKLHDRR